MDDSDCRMDEQQLRRRYCERLSDWSRLMLDYPRFEPEHTDAPGNPLGVDQ